jgi:hypothetical protein
MGSSKLGWVTNTSNNLGGYIGCKQMILIGCPQSSGSTLLATLLNGHPDLLCGPELGTFKDPRFWTTEGKEWREVAREAEAHETSREWYGLNEERLHNLIHQNQNGLDFAARLFMPLLWTKYCKKVWAEKTPDNLKAFSTFPGKKVCLVRNAWDTIASHNRKWWDRDLEEVLDAWQTSAELCMSIPDGTYLLRYEDLIQQPRKTLFPLLEYLEVDTCVDTVLCYQSKIENLPQQMTIGNKPPVVLEAR